MIFDETAFSPNGKCAHLFDPFLFLPLMLTENLDVHFLTFKFPCPKVGDPTKFLLVSHLYMSHDTRFPEGGAIAANFGQNAEAASSCILECDFRYELELGASVSSNRLSIPGVK